MTALFLPPSLETEPGGEGIAPHIKAITAQLVSCTPSAAGGHWDRSRCSPLSPRHALEFTPAGNLARLRIPIAGGPLLAVAIMLGMIGIHIAR